MKTRLYMISSLAIVVAIYGCGPRDESENLHDGRNDSRTLSPEPSGGSNPRDRQNDTSEPRADEPSKSQPNVIEVPSTDCEALVPISCEQVYGPSEMPALRGLQSIGDGFLAEGIWDSGFVVFDESGKTASSELIRTGSLDRASASLDEIHVATVDLEGVKARIYDSTGHPLGAAFSLSSDAASEVAIGTTGSISLAVWTTPTRVAARSFSRQGPGGDAFELESGVLKDDFRVAIANTGGDELVIAWSDRRVSDSHHRVFFLRVNESGSRGLVRTLVDSLDPHRVVDLRRTPEGYALLLAQRDHALVLPLTTSGDPAGPAHRFQGLSRVHGLAVHESGEMLLSGLREDGRDALRALGVDGSPLSDWKCLEAYPSDGEHVVSVAAMKAGFSVLYRSAISQQLLLRLDAR